MSCQIVTCEQTAPSPASFITLGTVQNSCQIGHHLEQRPRYTMGKQADIKMSAAGRTSQNKGL